MFIIDRRLHKAAIVSFAEAILTVFGFIHSARLGFFPTSQFVIAYVVVGCVCILLHLGRGKWFDGGEESDYD